MKRFAPTLIALVVACGGNGATTTTGDTPTTATTGSTTTSATTSTTAATTTTTAAPDPESRWWPAASGSWVGGMATPGFPGTAVAIPLVGGEQFQVVLLDEPISTVTGSPVGSLRNRSGPRSSTLIRRSPKIPRNQGGLRSSPIGIFVHTASPCWRPFPRSTGDAVAQFLSNRGIDDADLNIEQVVVTDIEGDGVAEVLMVVNRLPPDLFGRPGDYSAVLLRKQIEGEWQTAVLEFDEPEDESPYILKHVVAAMVDLNDDARMEIVIDAFYYEGAGTVAYEYVNDDLGPQEAIGGGCGA